MKTKNIEKQPGLTLTFALIGLFICFSELYAQNKVITLEESKKEALQYNYDIKNGELNIERVKSIKKVSDLNYSPQVEAFVTGIYGFSNFIPEQLVGTGIDNIYFTGLSVTEPIYMGGRRKFWGALADLQMEVSRIKAKQAKDSVVLVTEQKYWQLVHIQEQHKVLDANQKYLTGLLKQQEDWLNSGLIAKNDLFTVRVEISNLLLQKNKLDNLKKIALLDFALYTGIDYDTAIVVEDAFDLTKEPDIPFLGPNLKFSEYSNYQLLEKSVEVSQIQTKIEKGKFMPTVSLGFNTIHYSSFNNSRNSDFIPVVSGTVSIPISTWWGKGKEAIKQQEIGERIAMNNLKRVENQLKVGVMQSWYNLSDSRIKIINAKENFRLAGENLKANRDNYESGLSGLTELLNAQRMFSQARTELVRAFVEKETAEVAYLYKTNQIEIPE